MACGVRLMPASRPSSRPAKARQAVVAEFLQPDAQRADASRVLGFAGHQLHDDEVEQLPPRRQVGPATARTSWRSQWSSVSDVAGQPRRPGLGQPGKRQLGGKLDVGSLVGRHGLIPAAQRLAPRRGALGKARQQYWRGPPLTLDVEHIAVAPRVAPGRPLPGAQALPGIGDGVGRAAAPRGGVEQVHALCVSASRCCSPPGGSSTTTGHRRRPAPVWRPGEISSCRPTPECLAESWLGVDRGSPAAWPPGGRHGREPRLTMYAQQVAQELDDAAIRAAADQRQRDDHLASQVWSPPVRTAPPRRARRARRRRSERRTGLVRLLIDELGGQGLPRNNWVGDRPRCGWQLPKIASCNTAQIVMGLCTIKAVARLFFDGA